MQTEQTEAKGTFPLNGGRVDKHHLPGWERRASPAHTNSTKPREPPTPAMPLPLLGSSPSSLPKPS